jgi:hypothetical protein
MTNIAGLLHLPSIFTNGHCFFRKPDASHQPALRQMQTDEFWQLKGRQGRDILCRSGKVWITEEGKAEDYILSAGESFHASGKGLVVVQALTDAQLLTR